MTRTHTGKNINMSQLKEKNANKITIGNMKTNVRGDLLGPGGKIVKTKEQLASEKYDKKRTKKVTTTGALNTPVDELLKGSKKKPVRFVDQQNKKKNDIETLGKYDLGEAVD
jgi:hypothetical protein